MAEDRSSPESKRMKLEYSEAASKILYVAIATNSCAEKTFFFHYMFYYAGTASAKERRVFPRPILADEYTREIETSKSYKEASSCKNCFTTKQGCKYFSLFSTDVGLSRD